MAKKKKVTAARSTQRWRSRRVGSSAVLEKLAGRYARFRREHPRGARIPKELRAATLVALEKGVSASELHHRCGVSWSQVAAWRAQRSSPGEQVAREGTDASDVRVFSVVDEATLDGEASKLATAEAELELRLGAWSVTVRLGDPRRTKGA